MTETMIDMRWSKPFEIGPRQTVDRAKHPTLGEGRLVYDNGPSFFISDSGECVALSDVGLGGCRSEPRYSWRTAIQDGRLIELEDTGRQHGDQHMRIFSPMIGHAWLVHLGTHPPRTMVSRVEPDGGKAFEIQYHFMTVGLAEHCVDRPTKKTDAEMDAAGKAGWRTYKGDFGTFTWCHEADKDKALHYLEHRNDQKPEKPKRKKVPSGPMPDFVNMTRAQIKAWQEAAGQ